MVSALLHLHGRLVSADRQRGRELTKVARLAIAGTLLVISIFLAQRFGLVNLIANGYRLLAYLILLVYVLPLMTYGVWWLVTRRRRAAATSEPRTA